MAWVTSEKHDARQQTAAAPAVAKAVVTSIAEWWPRVAACQALLEGPYWHRYLDAVTMAVTAGVAQSPKLGRADWKSRAVTGDWLVTDYLETIAGSNGSDGLALVPLDEQKFLHLRYRLGRKVPAIAWIMACSNEQARDLGRSVHQRFRDGLGI